MKRADFIKIIKIRSTWETGKGDYKLPNGDYLKNHICRLVESQLKVDDLAIMKNGDLCFSSGGNWNKETKWFDDIELIPMHAENEICSYDRMQARINSLVNEIMG